MFTGFWMKIMSDNIAHFKYPFKYNKITSKLI